MLRVLHVIETMAPHEGGPPRVAASLAAAQRSVGIDAHILCGDGAELSEHLPHWQAHLRGFPTEYVHTIFPRANNVVARAMALRGWLRANLTRFDVVHVHQLWRLVPTVAASACRRAHVPYLIAPHTSLSPWALAQKRTKKMFARRLAWDRILTGAAGFHALNELEAAEIRACIGPGGPQIFVVPNGVSLAELAESAAPRAPPIAGLFPSAANRPFILFLARLHTMKGPDLLLEAFAALAPGQPELQLVFAGPDFGMLDTLQRRVAQLGLIDRVHFLGLVSGQLRLWLLRNAVCLSQPSRDEGFSLSILEAMASERPVVISERCKFPEVAQYGAGIVVPMSAPDLASALSAYATDAARCRSDGRSARRLVENNYTWDIVTHKANQMYARVVGQWAAVSASGCERR